MAFLTFVRRCMMITIVVVASLGSAFPAFAEGDARRGRQLAETHCGRCHVVGESNRMGGIGSTPSFRTLRGMSDALERFTTFYVRRPHPVFVSVKGVTSTVQRQRSVKPFELTLEDIDDLISYFEAIETRKPGRVGRH